MSKDIPKLHRIFSSIQSILEKEEKGRWLSEIQKINEILDSEYRGDLSRNEAIDLIRKKYKSIHPSHGGFNEFFIWKDDFNERKRINSNLERLAQEAWDELDLI